MNNAFDNFIKGPLTSIIGLIVMCAAGYGWYTDHLTNWEGGGAGIVGFALLFMRDKIPGFITEFFKSLLSKFGGGNKTAITLIFLLAGVNAFSQTVNIGTVGNDRTGDNLRTSMTKLNNNDFLLDIKGTASGTDTYAVTISPPAPGYTTGISAITTYVTGQTYKIRFTNANTGASTLNINSLGAKSIVKSGSTPLVAGDISAGQVLNLYYDGTNLQVVGGGGGSATASNGLNKVGSDIRAGGALTQATDFTGAFGVRFGTTGASRITSFQVNTTGGHINLNADYTQGNNVTIEGNNVSIGSNTALFRSDAVTHELYGTNTGIFPTAAFIVDAGTNEFTTGVSGVRWNLGSDATGDIWYRNSSGYLSRLPIGSNGNILKIASGLPSWGTETVYTASNGLTKTGNDIKLGGSLTALTQIDGGFALAIGTVTPLTTIEGFTNDYVQFKATVNNVISLMTLDDAEGCRFLSQNTSTSNEVNYLVTPTGVTMAASGTAVKNFSLSNIRLVPGANATYPGLNIGTHTANPSTLANGDTWYNSTTHAAHLRINGVTETYATTAIYRNRQTTSYTLVLADNQKIVEMNSASATTLTVPANSSVAFPVDQTQITVTRYGGGSVTIAAAGGVTIRSADGSLILRAQYSSAQLIKIGTDEWYLLGDLQ